MVNALNAPSDPNNSPLDADPLLPSGDTPAENNTISTKSTKHLIVVQWEEVEQWLIKLRKKCELII